MATRKNRVTAPKNGKSITQRQFKQDADINHITAKHMKGAGRFGAQIGNPAATRKPQFRDISSIDFHAMCNKVIDVQNHFASLPSRTKGRFNNDPYQLLRFIEDPNNRSKALDMGLLTPTDEEVMQEHEEALRKNGAVQEDLLTQSKEQAPKPDPEANPRMAPKNPS